ncbi:hypothetical protein BDV06DRAFT_226535 [Aspergillus oleicola]
MHFTTTLLGALATFTTLTAASPVSGSSLESGNNLFARAELCGCAWNQKCGCPQGEWCVCSATVSGGAPCTDDTSCGCPTNLWGNCQVL